MSVSPSHRVSTGERLNTSETTGKLQQAIRERRIRLTRQRRVILEVMDDAEQHLDVDQILERAQKIDHGVHLVTVYRTIDLLKKHGLDRRARPAAFARRPPLLRKAWSARSHPRRLPALRQSARIREPALRAVEGADCARLQDEGHRVADRSGRVLRRVPGQDAFVVPPLAGVAFLTAGWQILRRLFSGLG